MSTRGRRFQWLRPKRVLARRWLRRLRRAPRGWQLLIWGLLTAGSLLAINGLYQVARKPTELFFPVSGVLAKTPGDTWQEYGAAFRHFATPAVSPELLAALAQVEGSGNPLVRTYWRWAWGTQPFELYRPASSAVGMYQITDGTFAEARHYCIHHHARVQEGPWSDWRSCWLNSLYLRVLPRDAIELTAAYLDLKVNVILAQERHARPTLAQREHLAAIIHLCGAGAGAVYAHRSFRLKQGERCGAHDPREYLRRVDEMRAVFTRLARADADEAAGAAQ